MDGLLLFLVRLPESFEDFLLISFKTASFTVFLTDADDLLLDDVVFLLSYCGPLLCGDLLTLLFGLLLLGFDQHASLLQLFELLRLLLFLGLKQLLSLFLDGGCLLFFHKAEFLSAAQGHPRLIRHDGSLRSELASRPD